jgi:UDPglucose--hexose-1-phosphate uridylyltransferase
MQPTLGFNGMIYPLTGLNVRGVVWYQGCSNAFGTQKYYDKALKIFIDQCREMFDNPQLSFTICELARYENKYILDLILRNNCTSEEHPDGIYHAHKEYHNIKKEAIGLIEAGGMFILPARLKRQLGVVSSYLQTHTFDTNEIKDDMVVHKDMIVKLIEENGIGHSEAKANEIVKLEIERVCREILINTAVYKDTEKGNKAFIDFMNYNDLYLI